MAFKDILITICTVSWITCSLLDARTVKNIQVERNVATDMCPTPKAPLNGQVDCEYSDALQIEIFCRVSCKTGYMFDKTDSLDFMFPCDVATGFFDTVITPDCIRKFRFSLAYTETLRTLMEPLFTNISFYHSIRRRSAMFSLAYIQIMLCELNEINKVYRCETRLGENKRDIFFSFYVHSKCVLEMCP
ncbi:uncharacterized protein LOC129928172 [Biomphalaria glabrata]|uniref:Uncharacterized protein LOC129928172 n=1 Tax=Biomphalaria glabrata TaxID=6526 RepID=A0A9W3BCK3_BIOGL|nr:uncharacterized protein LOC129928172 [Biomphalaria glabrata]